MKKLNRIGQVIFGISLIGFAVQQFIDSRFRPFLISEWPAWIPGMEIWAYLLSVILLFAGVCMITGWNGKVVSLYTGALLLLVLLFFHIPYRLNHSPEILGAWTNDLKLLALSGSCFIAAAGFKHTTDNNSSLTRFLERLIPLGRIFFCLMLIVFGIDHFLYADFVKTLVPTWMPGGLFWTYFAAVALIGSGVAILFRIKTRLAALLLATMLFLWFAILHIPRGITFPYVEDNGNEVTSVLQCFGFGGVALIIAGLARNTVSKQ
jgi:uncharacterized membrane protein YphA (DoxX/SURF4 family)